MKTDELIAMLASGASPVESGVTARRFRTALGWGVPGAILLMVIVLGVRPDLAAAARLPMFWMKLVFPLLVAALALVMAQRLARPGMRLGRLPMLLATVLLALWAAGAFTVAEAPPSQRSELIFGESWASCPFNIALLSIPLFIGAMWAMKGLAPTRLALAGGAAGLLAGAVSATVYALHCPEMQIPFIGIWYVLGMLIPTVAGFLAGKRLLRW